MSSQENENPQEEKAPALDMRSVLLPQAPAEVDLRATASAPPPTEPLAPLPLDAVAGQEPAETVSMAAMEGFEGIEGLESPLPPAEEFLAAPGLEAPPPGSALGEAASDASAFAETVEDEEAEPAEEVEERPGFFARLAEHVNSYDALMIVAFLALLLGVVVLLTELKRYGWDMRAKSGKQPVSAAALFSDRGVA